MGLFIQYTCPKCGKASKLFRWGAKKCPYCSPVVVPNYDLIGLPVSTVLTPTQEGLYKAGLVYPGAQVCVSEMHPDLMKMATRHAKYQADHQTQGHQLFDSRVAELRRTMSCKSFAEIAAESWELQQDDPPLTLGTEMFNCWRQSPGHWSVASKRHQYFGCDMALGSNGIWYAAIIVGD